MSNMADDHDNTHSDVIESVVCTATINNDSLLKLKLNNEYDTAIIEKNLKLAWHGDYQSVKCLVAEFLKLNGKWDSPGGEKKVFYCDGSQTIVWLSKKKLLQIEGANARSLQRKLISSIYDVNRESESASNNLNQGETLNRCECPEIACRCNELITELEGVKLDITIAETRLEKAINNNFNELERVRALTNKMQIEVNKIHSLVNVLNDVKLKSNVNECEVMPCLREENNVLLSTVNALTLEMVNSKYPAKLNMDGDEVVTTYVNTHDVGVLSAHTMGTNQPAKSKHHLAESPELMHMEPQDMTFKTTYDVNSQYVTHDQSFDVNHENTDVTHELNSNGKNVNDALLQNLGTGAHSDHSNLSDQMHTPFLNQLQAYKAKHRNRLQIETLDVCNPNSNREPHSRTSKAQSNRTVHSPTSFPKQILAYKVKHSNKFLANTRNVSFYHHINDKDIIKTKANRKELLPKTNTNKRSKKKYDRKLKNADATSSPFNAHGNVCTHSENHFTNARVVNKVPYKVSKPFFRKRLQNHNRNRDWRDWLAYVSRTTRQETLV